MSSQLGYYQCMGFDSAELRRRYAPYAERFETGQAVLDLGCGRGEFLELLAARGVQGVGLDADEGMVQTVQAKGLNAVRSDAIEYLQQNQASFDGIFAAHLIEHLAPDAVICLVRAAAGALRPSGRLILVTPNPGNLQMQLKDFWIDLQHVRFYSPEIARWILHDAGLHDIETGENPIYRTGPEIGNRAVGRLPFALPAARGPKHLVKRTANRFLRISPLRRRLIDVEQRLNALTDWMQGLYPPAEYFMTGVR